MGTLNMDGEQKTFGGQPLREHRWRGVQRGGLPFNIAMANYARLIFRSERAK
jgi:hypothetical protein